MKYLYRLTTRCNSCAIQIFLFTILVMPASAKEDNSLLMLLQDAHSSIVIPKDPEPIKVQIVPSAPVQTSNVPYFGYGKEKTVELVTFPVVHPIKLFNKITFPGRHPLLFVKRSGEVIGPYQNGINSLNAVKNLLSPVP